MKGIAIFFALLVGGMIFFHQSLQNGRILHYIDQHPHEKGVASATYYIGQGYYLFQSLPEATTYFLRVAQRYPNTEKAEVAYFNYLQCPVDTMGLPLAQIIEGYVAYLEKYPNGSHARLVQNRLDNYRTGGS